MGSEHEWEGFVCVYVGVCVGGGWGKYQLANKTSLVYTFKAELK